jgi:hypothetical protein
MSEEFKQELTKSKIGKLAELLERSGINVDEVGKIDKVRVSEWQGLTKNENGEAEVHNLNGVSMVISPKWESGPEWPVIQQGPPIKLPVAKVSKEKASDWKEAVILPDMQIGFYNSIDNVLQPTHDPVAIDCAIDLVASVKPSKVVMHGDNLDLPELGKYRLSPAFQRTTQAAIDYATQMVARLRAAAPDAEIIWLAGNHEERLVNYILDNASAAFGLKRGNKPDEWPVLSVPYLCRFDDFKIKYIPGYPAGYYWINEKLKIIHGTRVKSNGSTAHMYLSNEKTSVLYGHIHRREWAELTRDDYDGPKTILAASAGCLARCDGAVPSTKGGIDLDGRPMTVTENWQQGLAVVTYKDGDEPFHLEMIPIRDGSMFYRGKIWSKS